ncbi:hypothetical protein Q4506_07475 [Colwellia sp. 4_MG-2023]|jgi:hypothetical protein|uniref:hypothetical protein n=1 Tax=unclassified Colwellia TaxID=196834 RepID=UPI001C096B78|nr:MULTISPECIES: hypothetical protein [unclassified Colwellia]MBU2923218.1 hypothetical protein [Colwellia sp. C2M11]MDO6486621.1 hypothetical protein [Colwellia sp. 6_MG-2023]MDO6506691.1 hypothetical protein [Colwellia sp. 5_MG-2023]MDO6555517.1 hypothetical protein [Colwellia sp. 4_MG-2023]MDO6651352.1 hypothetical protein [Colwellia sp. 3_MG-2023]
MSQTSLWQTDQQSNDFAEICNALYERELRLLAHGEFTSVQSVQGRLKSLSYYIKRTANLMTQVNAQGISPLTLDIQNASWSAKQASKLSLSGQTAPEVSSWYLTQKLTLGLVVPIFIGGHVILDSIDKIDVENKRLRSNVAGWISLSSDSLADNFPVNNTKIKLLKPNKKIMLAACAGHCWKNKTYSSVSQPIIPSLRELLLSCAINWKDFKQPLAL